MTLAGFNDCAPILTTCFPKRKREKLRFRKRNLFAASDRLRVKICNLFDELHHQAALWLVDNYDLILIPSFETSEMAQRGQRKLRSKSVRMLLSFAHFRFRHISDLESLADREAGHGGKRSVHQQDL